MHCEILLIDSRLERTETVRSIFEKKGFRIQRIDHLGEAVGIVEADSRQYVLLTHCDFLNDSFTSLARLRQNSRVKILFYSTNQREKLRSAPLIPDEADMLVERIRTLGCQGADNQA